jgi:predicted dehydrogenase
MIPGLVLEAVCDVNPEQLKKAQEQLGAKSAWTDYQEMLDKADLDAVIVSTPMHFHAPQSIAALKRGLHVLCEVTPAVNMEECRELVSAARQSKGIYMLAENYIFMRTNMTVTEMVRRGVMGTPYYAEGEYLHELKDLNERTTWRRRWQTGVNGITYGTHSLGPILQWMPGDRVTRVSCEGTGRRHVDPRGDAYENEASCVMLCKTRNDALIKIRVDMLSDRPHAMTNYQLQATDGCFESGRGIGDDSVWLRSRSAELKWTRLKDLQDEFVSPEWKRYEQLAMSSGHGGSDLIELMAFVETIRGERSNPLDIDAAMDAALPGLVSQQSIAQDGQWLPVPDSREWS